MLNEYGICPHKHLENHSKAIDCFEQALAINETLLPSSYPYLGTVHSSLANAYR